MAELTDAQQIGFAITYDNVKSIADQMIMSGVALEWPMDAARQAKDEGRPPHKQGQAFLLT